jgi:O-antigen ligase/Flp pilus assembly protein TadD
MAAAGESERKPRELLALALLAPPFLLAWPGPGALLENDFLPQSTGIGAVALATLPAAFLLVIRRAAPEIRALPLFLVTLLVTAGWLAFGHTSDSFELRRVVVRSAVALALLLAGASLSPAGLAVYARGLLWIAVLLLAVALLDRANGLAGALGNTGSIAQAALPGAIAGACLASQPRSRWKIFGGLACLLFLAYVARAPVIAGGLALAAGLAAFALARSGLSSRLRALYVAAAILAAFLVVAPLGAHKPAPDAPPASGSTGGFEVRKRVWSSSLAMLRDHPWAGVGPGQFAASFPPYRDPQEIELSTHGRRIDAETEVEQPHEDWLAPALDLGIVAGIAWIGFLLAVAHAAWRALRGAEPARAALGAAALAILAYALVHGPLTQEPAAASIACVVFGAVLAPAAGSPASPTRRWVPLAALFLLLTSIPAAFAFVRHGRALAGLAVSGERDAADVEASIEAARRACPDSVLALTLRARLDEERKADPATVRADWERVLALRPARIEALMQLALAELREGDAALARETWERAQRLDPGHPGIRRNLRALDLQEGRFDAGREWLAGEDPVAESCFARAKAERASGDTILADLFEARAHLLWARSHADAGRFGDAVRSYRQCLRVTRDHVDGGARRVGIELAAALAADGRESEARQQLGSISPTPADLERLPDWATARLSALLAGG